MKLAQFKLLTDENIHRGVAERLRQRGFNVAEVGLFGTTDVDLPRRAVSEDRVVVTHDQDFGTPTILGGESIVGIVSLRPGHIAPEFTMETIDAAWTGAARPFRGCRSCAAVLPRHPPYSSSAKWLDAFCRTIGRLRAGMPSEVGRLVRERAVVSYWQERQAEDS